VSKTTAKILVIEDDARIATALSIRLSNAGYDVATASDGLEGLKRAVEVRPDLIISDIWMPGSVGFLVAERIKAFGLGSIPVIFITANKKKNLSRLARDVGAAEFFEKPYDPEELLAAVARALKQSSAVSHPSPSSSPSRRRSRKDEQGTRARPVEVSGNRRLSSAPQRKT